jgi:hypothetical protein
MHAFAGKLVVIWGCGALGAPIAESVIRAGASAVILYDNASVHPGVLIRQPFIDDDLGRAKAVVLAHRLERIFPGATVAGEVRNVLTDPLDRADWHDGADILIDATASTTVQAKLERARRRHPQPVTIITALVGHTAERGLATVAARTSQARVRAPCARPSWPARAAGGWRGSSTSSGPTRRAPSTSSPSPAARPPTFRGSAAEATALAGIRLTAIAGELGSCEAATHAVAHLVALPTADHRGTRSACLELPAATVLADSATRFEVRLSAAAAAQLRAGIASARRRLGPEPETGGVLFGERDDAAGLIWIDEATGPPPDSTESPELFLCGTQGVRELDDGKRHRTSGTVGVLGMWHTHPRQSADFSRRDLQGMLELLDASDSPRAQGLIVIVGWAATAPQLGAYISSANSCDTIKRRSACSSQRRSRRAPSCHATWDLRSRAGDPAPSRSTWAACAPSTTRSA